MNFSVDFKVFTILISQALFLFSFARELNKNSQSKVFAVSQKIIKHLENKALYIQYT